MASMVMSKLRDKRVVIDFYGLCHCSCLASTQKNQNGLWRSKDRKSIRPRHSM